MVQEMIIVIGVIVFIFCTVVLLLIATSLDREQNERENRK